MKAYRSAPRTCSEDKKKKPKPSLECRGRADPRLMGTKCIQQSQGAAEGPAMGHKPGGVVVPSYRTKTSLACSAFPFLSLCKILISSAFGGKTPTISS